MKQEKIEFDEKKFSKEYLLLYYELINRYEAYKNDYKKVDAAIYLINMSNSLGFNIENEIINQKVLKIEK